MNKNDPTPQQRALALALSRLSVVVLALQRAEQLELRDRAYTLQNDVLQALRVTNKPATIEGVTA